MGHTEWDTSRMSSYAGERSGMSEGQFVELHVLVVPEEQWNWRLNKVSVDAVDSFISAGFIRVYPETTLKGVRDELGGLFEPDKVAARYCFLKCIGRSLAWVKPKQEKDLKMKCFVPPNSPYPELYLLPVEEHSSFLCSRSYSPDMAFYNTDSQTYYHLRGLFAPGLQRETKEPTKFPLIKQGPQQSVLDPSLEDEGSLTSFEEREKDSGACEDTIWPEVHNTSRSDQEGLGAKKYEMILIKQSPSKVGKKEKRPCYNKHFTRDSGIPESLEDPDTGFFLSQGRKFKQSQTLRPTRKKQKAHVDRPEPLVLVESDSAPSVPSLAQQMQKPCATPTNRDELLKELTLVKEERKQLEETRQELLRKGKDLLALNRHHRNQARDKWKRKYFETKKAMAPLEATLKSLRQELETFYDKLFQQLQARDGRIRQRQAGKPFSTKNDFIIQIMTESCEIDNLKKNVDDAKMKLATEIKLRKQATTELQALKAELMQKKSQCLYAQPLFISADVGSQFDQSKLA